MTVAPTGTRRLTLLTILVLTSLSVTGTASAHPFGPPLEAELEGIHYHVNLRWTAADDDWLALARHVGAFDEVPETLDGEQLSGTQRIGRSQRVADYALDRIAVTQYDQTCPGEVVHLDDDLRTEGIILQFSCEEQVYEVDIRMEMLTDIHPAYRTVATSVSGGTPGETLYTATEPLQRWDFHAASPPEPARLPWGPIAGVTVLVFAAGVLLWLGLRTGRAPDVATPPGPDPHGPPPTPPPTDHAELVGGTGGRT
jgi:hypothetical protein